MKNKCPFYIVFQILKALLIKICKIEPPDLLFIVVFISFYISRYYFSQIFRTSFNIIWKKDFRHEFSFFNRFTKSDKSFLSMLPYLGLFVIHNKFVQRYITEILDNEVTYPKNRNLLTRTI